MRTTLLAGIAATVFAVGVCYLWPTMLGFVSERVPRSGALGLGLMGTVGMAAVGLGTAPWMGSVADRHAHDVLPTDQALVVLVNARGALDSEALRTPGPEGDDLRLARDLVVPVLQSYDRDQVLPVGQTAAALRAIIGSGSTAPSVEQAEAILGPAENHGGRMSFRYLVPVCALLTGIFGLLYLRDRRSGGYRVERTRT